MEVCGAWKTGRDLRLTRITAGSNVHTNANTAAEQTQMAWTQVELLTRVQRHRRPGCKSGGTHGDTS